MMRKDQDSLQDPYGPSSHAAREFRVLAGLHAGARFAWPPQAGVALRVGAHAGCDIVLQDAALATRDLRLRIAPDGQGWLALEAADEDEDENTDAEEDADTHGDRDVEANREADQKADREVRDAGTVLAFGQAWIRAGLALTIAHADAPWPPLPPRRRDDADAARQAAGSALASNPASGGGPGETGSTPGTPPAATLPSGGGETAAPYAADRADPTRVSALTARDTAPPLRRAHGGASTARPTPGSTLASGRRRDWRRVGFLGTGTVALVAPCVVLLAALLRAPRQPPPRAVARVAALQNQSPAAVTKLLERLGLTERLHLGTTDDGLIAVTGWVADTAQRDALADALAQLAPMPAMRVLVASEAVAAAQQVAGAFGAMLEARYDGGDRIALSGAIDDETRRAALRQAFAEQLPGAVLIDRHVLSRAALAQALRAALDAAGIGGARVGWTSAGLDVAAPAGTDAERFETALARFRDGYGRRLPLLARVGTAAAPFVATGLPFALVSVSGGALPSVVVAGGARLLPGGTYRGYRLISVDAGSIVFDGPRRVTIAR